MESHSAFPPFRESINDGLSEIENLVNDAAEQQAEIICFPESYIPGYPTVNVRKMDAGN